MDPIYEETKTFELTITNQCTTDKITLLEENFEDYIYYIGEHTDAFVYHGTPAYTFGSAKPLTHQRFYASWQTSVPYCPIEFELLKDDGAGTYIALTASESSVIKLINDM